MIQTQPRIPRRLHRSLAAGAALLLALAVGGPAQAQVPCEGAPVPLAIREPAIFANHTWQIDVEPLRTSAARDSTPAPEYRPTHWKRGLLIGAAIGAAVFVVAEISCPGGTAECTSTGRKVLAVPVAAGIGALVGLFIPRKAPG